MYEFLGCVGFAAGAFTLVPGVTDSAAIEASAWFLKVAEDWDD
jgi:hypothetical protein